MHPYKKWIADFDFGLILSLSSPREILSSSSSLIVSLFLALEQGSTTIKLDLETED